MKKLNLSSPLGIALTVAGLVLALSPEARRGVRKLMVRGTAGVMDAMEQVGGTTAGIMKAQPVSWKSGSDNPVVSDVSDVEDIASDLSATTDRQQASDSSLERDNPTH